MKINFDCYFNNKIDIKGAWKPYEGRYATVVWRKIKFFYQS